MAPSLGRLNGNFEFQTEDLSGKSEMKSGSLFMVSPRREQPDIRVQVRLYRTTWDHHYAVIYPDKTTCSAIGCINLRNCKVESDGSKCFRIVQLTCDAVSLSFRALRTDELQDWIVALKVCCESDSTPLQKKLGLHRNGPASLEVVEEGDEE